MDINEEIKKFRNQLRIYSGDSIVAQALRVLHHQFSSPLEDLKAAPWLTMLIVKWAVRDIYVYQSIGKVISPQKFDALRNLLWDIQGIMSSGQNTPNFYATLRAMLHPQIQFQRRETWGFLRWPALISQLDLSHPNRTQFEKTFLMSPETYMDLSFVLYTQILRGKKTLPPDYFASIEGFYGDNIPTFLELFSRDFSSLRRELQENVNRPMQGRIEFFEFPYLQRFPIFRTPDRALNFWHRSVFARGMEDAVHLRLSEFGPSYTEPFSKVFEGYVLDILKDNKISFFGEDEIRNTFSRKDSAVEAIIDCPDCNVFIEAKMSLFWDDVLLDDRPQKVFNKTERIRTAIQQGWRASDLLRSERGQLGGCANKAQDFLLVVTSRQLNISGGNMLNNLYPNGLFESVLPIEKRRYLPPENIFVLSIEDFELLTGCVQSGSVALGSLLRNAAIANNNPKTSRMFFSDFLREHQGNNRSQPRLIQLAMDASIARLSSALGGEGSEFSGKAPPLIP